MKQLSHTLFSIFSVADNIFPFLNLSRKSSGNWGFIQGKFSTDVSACQKKWLVSNKCGGPLKCSGIKSMSLKVWVQNEQNLSSYLAVKIHTMLIIQKCMNSANFQPIFPSSLSFFTLSSKAQRWTFIGVTDGCRCHSRSAVGSWVCATTERACFSSLMFILCSTSTSLMFLCVSYVLTQHTTAAC